MNTIAYINGTVLAGGHLRDDLTVITGEGRIKQVQSARIEINPDAEIVDLRISGLNEILPETSKC